jgi:hypothetical protein
MAISLLAMKSPQRALIIAPQGSMRASKIDDDDDDSDAEEMSASQWLKELHKFAPYLQVWEIFNHADYLRILALNKGELPYGVFVTYYEAFFTNGAIEKAPGSWDDHKLNQWAKVNGLAEQFEVVSIKGDAVNLCLRGKRVARDFVPVDGNSILADALDRFNLKASTPESDCEVK